MKLGATMIIKISQTQEDKSGVFSHMWNLHLYLHIYVKFMHVMKVEGEIGGKGGRQTGKG